MDLLTRQLEFRGIDRRDFMKVASIAAASVIAIGSCAPRDDARDAEAWWDHAPAAA